MLTLNSYSRIVICSLISVALVPMAFFVTASISSERFGMSDLSALLDRTEHNFGIVEVGPALKCTFRLTNTTEHPITVQKIKSDCGCLIHNVKAHTVKQGDFCNLEFVLETSRFKPPYYLRKKALIEIEMAGRSHLIPLVLSADLRGGILFKSSKLSLDSVDSPAIVSIRRDLLSVEDFATLCVAMENTNFRIKETHRSEEEILLTVQPVQNDLANHSSSIEVLFESRGVTKKASLPVTMAIPIKDIEIVPSSYVASFTKGMSSDQLIQDSSQEFELHSRVGENVVITKIESSEPSTKGLFGWQISMDEPHRFRVWTSSLSPSAGVASMILTVSYEHTIEGRTVSDTIPLTAHSLTTHCGHDTATTNLPFTSR